MGMSALARFSDVVVDHPRLILLCVALVTLPALDQLIDFGKFEPQLDIDPSMDQPHPDLHRPGLMHSDQNGIFRP